MHFMKIHQFGKDHFSGLATSTIFLLMQYVAVNHVSSIEWQVYCLFPSPTENLTFQKRDLP